MKKISELQEKYFLFSPHILKVSIFASCISFILLFMQIQFPIKIIQFIFSVLGVFIITLLLIQMRDEEPSRQLKYGIIASICMSVNLTLGSYLAKNLMAENIFIIIYSFIVCRSFFVNAYFFTSSLYIFNFFIIGTGFHSQLFSHSFLNGISSLIGSIPVSLGSYVLAKFHFKQNNLQLKEAEKKKNSFLSKILFEKTDKSYFFELASGMLICNCIAHYFNLPDGYWLPMTALLVSNPSHEFVFTRVRHRFWGTFLGSFIGIPLCFVDNKYVLSLLLIPTIFFIMVSFTRHYGSYVFFLTALISILMNLMTNEGLRNVEFRVLNTTAALIIVGVIIYISEVVIRLINKRRFG